MIQKAFAVYDSKLAVYAAPFLAINKGHAIRILTELVNRPDHDFNKYAQDFTLFEIGEYDDSVGRYSMLEANVNVTGLWELRDKQEESRQVVPDIAEPLRKLKGHQ